MSIKRQTHLDSLRGLAALLVVIAHHFAVFYPYAIFGVQGAYLQRAEWESLFFLPPFGLLVAGQFAVCLFFILSGYVLSYGFLGERVPSGKIVAAIVKRPVRLGGLVWFSLALVALLWHFGLFFNGPVAELTHSKPFFNGYWLGSFDFSLWLEDLTTSAFSRGNFYNSPLWTIKMELYGSIMVFLFVLLFGNYRYRRILMLVLLLLTKNTLYQGFVLGMLIADLLKQHIVDDERPMGTGYYLLLALFVFIASYPNYVKPDFIEQTVYGFLPDDSSIAGGYPMLAALLLFMLVTTQRRIKTLLHHRVLQFFGEISYGVYVLHFIVIGSFSSWLFLQLHGSVGYGAAFLLVLLADIPLIFLAAYLATKYVDEPAIALAAYIGRKTSSLFNK